MSGDDLRGIEDDPRDFLTRSGFPLTKREDGLFDIAGMGTGLTADEVWDAFFRLWFWPEPWPPKWWDEPVEQKLCGG